MRILCLTAAALVLVGCQTKKLPISETATISPTFKDADGIDVFAGKRRNGEAVPAYRGDQFIEVRSFQHRPVKNTPHTRKTEFAGARCVLSGTGFEGNVTTPSKIRVPIYGYESSELAVRCVADGYQPVVKTVRAINKTKSDRFASASGAGLIGVFVVAAVNAASDETKHVFLYGPLNVDFKN